MEKHSTHKVSTTERIYRGVNIRKRKDGKFEYVAITYYAGMHKNAWHAAGLSTLKNVVADIDNRIDDLGWVAVFGKLNSPQAVAHQATVDANK